LNTNSEENERKNSNYLNTDIEKSILPVINTNYESNNNNKNNKQNNNKKQNKKKLKSSLYATEINIVENSSKIFLN